MNRSPDPKDSAHVISHSEPSQNYLLRALRAAEAAHWLPLLEEVELPLGAVLYEAGGTLSHVYFPTTAIVSLLYVMQDGASAEIAVVGNEGIVGISLFMGGESTPSRAVVQSAGPAYRLAARFLQVEIRRGGSPQAPLPPFTQPPVTQMAPPAVS